MPNLKKHCKVLFFTCLCFITCQSLQAQETEDWEEEEDLEDFFGGEEMIKIATGELQHISKAPAVASVITAQDIKKMGANDLDEVLESVPGLHVSFDSQLYRSVYAVRGIASQINPQILFLINGLPISNLYLGNRGIGWSQMPVETISRIEVIRGPGSAIYGADAFSGTVNIITKAAEHIKDNQIGFKTGSYNTAGVWGAYRAKTDNAQFGLTLEYQTTDGHDEIIESDLQTIIDGLATTNASFAPSSVNLSQESFDLRADLVTGHWQFRVGVQNRYDLGTGAGIAESLDPQGRFESNRRNADITYHNPTAAKHWDVTLQAAYFYITQEVSDNLILFPAGSTALGPVYPVDITGNPEVFEEHYRFNATAFYKGFDAHSIRIGTGYHNANIFRVRESKNFALDANGDLINPGDPIVRVDDSPFIFLPESSRENNYFFIQDIWQLDNDWELTSGIRYDHYSDFGDTVNPRLALVWTTSHSLTTKILYGQAFRAPSFAETRNQNNPVAVGNLNLVPEEMETLELAFDYHPSQGARYSFNIFRYIWDDIISFVPDVGATTSTAQNQGKQTGYGVEFEFDYKINTALNLFGNIAVQESTDEASNTDTANVPQKQLYLGLYWKVDDEWQLNHTLNSVIDRTRTPGDPRPQIDDYIMINTRLIYHPRNSHWQFGFKINNLLDEEAFEPASPSITNDLPLAGTNFLVDVRYTFK